VKQLPENMVISYPNCGMELLRSAMDFLLTENECPCFYHDKSNQRKVHGVNKKRFKKSKVVFLVRNPFDVIVSYYDSQKSFKGSVSDFIESYNHGIKNLLKFYNTWHKYRTDPKKFIVLKYEDMHADMRGALKVVFDFYDLPQPSEDILSKAIEFVNINAQQTEDYCDRFSQQDIERIDGMMYKKGCVFYRPAGDKVYDFEQRMKNIIDAKNILEKLKIRYWLEGGTLLGFYRDNDFIKWDNDVDFLVFPEEVLSRLDEIKEEFDKMGFETVIKMQDEVGKRFKVSTVRGDDMLMICSYFLNKKTMSRVRVPYRFPDRLFGDSKINIQGIELPCPDPIEEYLELAYGPWKEPIMAERGMMYRRGKLTNEKLENNTLEKIYNKSKKEGAYKYYDTTVYHGYEDQDGD
jgi:hypothetical protein